MTKYSNTVDRTIRDILVRHSYEVAFYAQERHAPEYYMVEAHLELIDPIPTDATTSAAVLDYIEDDDAVEQACIQDWKANDGSPSI